MSGKIEDVVKRLRERAEARRRSGKLLLIDDRMFDLLADRIEAAIKYQFRDLTKTIPEEVGVRDAANSELLNSIKSYQINSSKAREALEKIRSCADYIYSNPNNIGGVQQCARDIMETIDKIASEPLRNCDVGTVKEQSERYHSYCLEHGTAVSCHNCPLYKNLGRCEFIWAQMPYEEVE